MKYIYLIDYYNPLQNNGLNSYVTQLTKQITKNRNIQLHIIWANAPFSSGYRYWNWIIVEFYNKYVQKRDKKAYIF